MPDGMSEEMKNKRLMRRYARPGTVTRGNGGPLVGDQVIVQRAINYATLHGVSYETALRAVS
jgi:hypothetical protein